MIEEVWNLIAAAEDSSHSAPSNSDDDELMALSPQAAQGTHAANTLKLHAYIQQKQSIILVDSGSSHNFISERLASQLQPWTPMPHLMTVKVADGSRLVALMKLSTVPGLLRVFYSPPLLRFYLSNVMMPYWVWNSWKPLVQCKLSGNTNG